MILTINVQLTNAFTFRERKEILDKLIDQFQNTHKRARYTNPRISKTLRNNRHNYKN